MKTQYFTDPEAFITLLTQHQASILPPILWLTIERQTDDSPHAVSLTADVRTAHARLRLYWTTPHNTGDVQEQVRRVQHRLSHVAATLGLTIRRNRPPTW